jgi:SAM-dependent methyltransferase
VKPPARLLDVGCAAGFALTALRARGYDVHGVELSAEMAALARRRLGADLIHCGVLEEGLFGGKFDVITMFDVVEHIEDPVAFLATARRMLNPGGVIVFETQNVASWFAKLMGVKWQHYKFQEHLYHFDPKTVRVLLGKAGLDLVEWSPRRGGKYVSLRFLVERAGRVHPLLSTLLAPLNAGRRAACRFLSGAPWTSSPPASSWSSSASTGGSRGAAASSSTCSRASSRGRAT